MNIRSLVFRSFFLLLLGAFGASLLFQNIFLSFGILLGGLYLWLLFEHSEWALFVSVMFIISFFSLMHEDFLRVAGVFRIRDIFFLLAFVPLLFGLLRKDRAAWSVFRAPLAKGIYFLLLITILQIILTKLQYTELSLNSILRSSRRYLYYAYFFPALYVLMDQKKFDRFIKLLCVSVGVFCVLAIMQYALGSRYFLFPYAKIETQWLQGFSVTRMYLCGRGFVSGLWQVLFSMILVGYLPVRGRALVLLALSGVETLLTFGRAHIFGIFTGTFFGAWTGRKNISLNVLKRIFVGCFLGVLFLVSVYFFSGEHRGVVNALIARYTSYGSSIKDQDDTILFRIKDSQERMDLIGKNVLRGVGFVHEEEASALGLMQQVDQDLRTGDSGVITLLLDFGLFGVIWLGFLSVMVYKRCVFICRKTKSLYVRAFILGLLSFYFGRLFSFITLADFSVYYDQILSIVLCLTMIEALAGRELLKDKA